MAWFAKEDLTFDTTPFPRVAWGGYGGLSFRPARSLATREAIIAAVETSGDTVAKVAEGVDGVHGRPASWAAYSGCLDGAETDEPDHPALGGLAILEHPGNSGFPHPVYATTAAAGFGFLASAPLMHEGMRLLRGEQFCLRYRTMVLGDEARPDAINQTFQAYSSTKAPRYQGTAETSVRKETWQSATLRTELDRPTSRPRDAGQTTSVAQYASQLVSPKEPRKPG
jgi:hypothetical protein